MTIKEIKKEWRVYSRYVPHTRCKPSSILKVALINIGSYKGMCAAISSAGSYLGLEFFKRTGLFTRTAYLRYHWACLEVWRKWWSDHPYWDDASDEAAERRIAFIKHLIKKLEKHGL